MACYLIKPRKVRNKCSFRIAYRLSLLRHFLLPEAWADAASFLKKARCNDCADNRQRLRRKVDGFWHCCAQSACMLHQNKISVETNHPNIVAQRHCRLWYFERTFCQREEKQRSTNNIETIRIVDRPHSTMWKTKVTKTRRVRRRADKHVSAPDIYFRCLRLAYDGARLPVRGVSNAVSKDYVRAGRCLLAGNICLRKPTRPIKI